MASNGITTKASLADLDDLIRDLRASNDSENDQIAKLRASLKAQEERIGALDSNIAQEKATKARNQQEARQKFSHVNSTTWMDAGLIRVAMGDVVTETVPDPAGEGHIPVFKPGPNSLLVRTTIL